MKEKHFLLVVFLAAVVLSIFGLWFDVANGQDTPQVVTIFTLSCYITQEGYADVLMASDGVEHYTFDNIDGIDTTIPSNFTTWKGVHPLGRMSTYGTYDLSFVRDDGVSAVLAMSPDWQAWCDKDNTPLEGTPEPTEAPSTPSPEQNAANGFVVINPPIPLSVVKMCVVKYPQLILVCNGA